MSTKSSSKNTKTTKSAKSDMTKTSKTKIPKNITKKVNDLLSLFTQFANNQIGVEFDSLLEENEMKMENLFEHFITKNLDSLKKIFPKDKKEKKPKDPNAPKRPASAYILYCNDNRAKLKKDNPEMKATEVTARLGQMWNEAKDKTKKKYEDQFVEAKKKYDEEMANYEPSEEYRSSKKEGKKRAPSAYILYCNDHRSEVKEANPEMKTTEITTELGAMWKALDKKTKDKYEKRAKEAKEALAASTTDEESSSTSSSTKPKKEKKVEKKEVKGEKKKKEKKGDKVADVEDEYSDLSTEELREKAEEMGIKGFKKMSKTELFKALRALKKDEDEAEDEIEDVEEEVEEDGDTGDDEEELMDE